MKLPQFYIHDVLLRALHEDISYVDVTADYLLGEDHQSKGVWTAKQSGVICGLEIAMGVFSLLDPHVDYQLHKQDGESIGCGEVVATLSGSTATLLKGERTALNIAQHLSGIATKTKQCVDLVKHTKAHIVCTRKTLPGLRGMQKYAVVMGGGKNHRYSLSDAAMLKDNHIDAYGGIIPAVKALRQKIGHMIPIEVETRTLSELKQAVEAGVSVVMLDNMDCVQMKQGVDWCRKYADREITLEASGNITLENLQQVAQTGVDIISIGALTHSVQAFDISMTLSHV